MPNKTSRTDWGPYAQHNSCFVAWLKKVDDLCDRFLDLELESVWHEFIMEDCYYDQKMTPEAFFKECIVPYMAAEHGQDFIDDLIGDLGTWGVRSAYEEEWIRTQT